MKAYFKGSIYEYKVEMDKHGLQSIKGVKGNG